MKKLIALAMALMMTAMLTACSVPEDGTFKDLIQEVETQEPSYEVPDKNTESETEAEETEKPAESTEETQAPTEAPKPTETPSQSTGGSTSKPAETTKPTETPKPVHQHSYSSSVTTQPTCTTAGVRTFTCSCGKSYTESVPAKGHDWGTRTATKQEQVWQEGAKHTVVVCTCGATFSSANAYDTHSVDMMLSGDTRHHSASDSVTQDPGKYVTKDVPYEQTYCKNCGATK